ncbi:MAG: hypothetical protein LBD12_04145 [Clostridiales Family XIII bacterium]|jgi:hypothetical protein|nr:hypothetical protein [Clostridiales Family XIII bacterium]
MKARTKDNRHAESFLTITVLVALILGFLALLEMPSSVVYSKIEPMATTPAAVQRQALKAPAVDLLAASQVSQANQDILEIQEIQDIQENQGAHGVNLHDASTPIRTASSVTAVADAETILPKVGRQYIQTDTGDSSPAIVPWISLALTIFVILLAVSAMRKMER